MKIISKKDLESLLSMSDILAALEMGFRAFKEEGSVIPLRSHLDVQESEGVFLYMPAYLPGLKICGVKIVSVFPNNAKQGKQTIYASYLLSDGTTGENLALIEASTLTGMRTGGASALATRYLARQEARVLGIIGTGFQAFYQVKAIMSVRPIEKVLAYDLDQRRGQDFCRLLADMVPVVFPVDPAILARESEIIVTATTSDIPVFPGKEVKPGTHINAIGAYRPHTREIDEDVITRAKIVVDNLEGALAEGGDLVIPLKDGKIDLSAIHADLGDLVVGKKPGRERAGEITLYKSVGFALEDIVVAQAAYEKACRMGAGIDVNL